MAKQVVLLLAATFFAALLCHLLWCAKFKLFWCFLQETLPNETATVDISDELVYLSQCQQAFLLPQNVLQQIVVDAKGNLPMSLSMMQSFPQTSHVPNVRSSTEPWDDARMLSLSCGRTKPNGIGPLCEAQTGIAGDAAAPDLPNWHQQNFLK